MAMLGLLGAALLAGCSLPQHAAPDAGPHWQGRLLVRVQQPAPQAFSASFELQGAADRGQLLLLSALGTSLARLRWQPGQAVLERPGQPEARFDDLPQLARVATGADIPVAQLFDWLAGRATPAAGWEVDLGALQDGRLLARALQDGAELRIVLER